MTMPSDGQSQTPPLGLAERVQRRLITWKQRLLDLSKRNRALNFKVQKVSTVTIVDEQPAEVFRNLWLLDKSMRFRPTLPSKEAGAVKKPSTDDGDAAAVATSTDEDEDDSLGLDFAPYDAATLDERHTDDVLQCSATPEALDKSLRRLDEQARSTIEEQGVNTLFLALGLLYYKESGDSQEFFRAPILLVPVELTRKSARTGYIVRASDDDPIVNPSLAEYVRVNYGIVLPELPDFGEDTDYDLQDLFREASAIIAQQAGWRITTDIYLALFSFQKLVMYKDLEKNGQGFGSHDLVKKLVTRDGDHIVGLPPGIREMELDRDFAPEDTFQVVDADSSQLRAIAAVAKKHDLVLEGPPGTGKSQTITNLIAQALAAGKTVLFVAEKMAALEVVHRRLVAAGLGEFCLELHSTKANKRAVMQDLRQALDASLQRPQGTPMSAERLKRVRATLTEYASAVHAPHGPMELTPYRAYGELGALLNAPKLPFSGDEQQLTRAAFDEILRNLADLAVAAEDVGDVRQHPWRDAKHQFHGEGALDEVVRLASELTTWFAKFQSLAREIERRFAVPPIRGATDVDTAAAVAAILERSPGAPLAVLESSSWNAPPAEATSLVARGRRTQELHRRVSENFVPETLDQDHAADIAYVERLTQGILGFLAFLDGRYRSIKRRWVAYRKPGYKKPVIDQAADLKVVDEYRRERATLEGATAQGRELFGALWQGERSDWDVLDNYIRWVVEFRNVCVRCSLSLQAMEIASHGAVNTARVGDLQSAIREIASRLKGVQEVVGWPVEYFDDDIACDLAAVVRRVEAVGSSIDLANRWASFEQARAKLDGTAAQEMVKAAIRGEAPYADLGRAFQRAFYQKWLDSVVTTRPPLREFHTLTHEQRVAEFRALDERVIRENRISLVGRLREKVQRKLQEPDAAKGMPFLRSEMARQRRLSPLRRTLQHAESAIRAIKPCFMMSPLSVAQYLDGTKPSFDVVIFDEASQLPSEEAVGAISRGSQLVVVGDPKQLPPTNFFAVSLADVAPAFDDDGAPTYEDAESVLEEFMGVGIPVTRLKWHYRSAHESLITFSNVSFYDADLYTFPSVRTLSADYGLHFEHVADGVYEGKGLNMVEARRVVDAIVEHAKAYPNESLGVGTFNLRQQLAIQDELELRRRQDPSIEPFFANDKPEPFFVKNLENVQGDERDVIFLSVTYARGSDGRLRYNFGPINGQNGWRRLNVLTTRAKKRMRVFSSMKGDEISPATSSSEGPRLLREFLLYAERRKLESTLASAQSRTESPLERDVLTELTRRGYLVDPQVGVAGYRIDLGVRDPAVPGRYVCGIECDGVAYHASETARDRDRLRQQVLEARGWTIARLWSTDWFKDRAGQIQRLVDLIENSKKNAFEEREAEEEARKRAADLQAQEEKERQERALSAPPAPTVSAPVYVRPTAPDYRMASVPGHRGTDILTTPLSHIASAVVEVVNVESPVHRDDVASRLAGIWGTRLGSRISVRVDDAITEAVRKEAIENRNDLLWKPGSQCTVRSRAGTKIAATRVAPEEYAEAIRIVLRAAGSLERDELKNEVRALLGFGRASALGLAFDEVVDAMLEKREIGEASGGLALRG